MAVIPKASTIDRRGFRTWSAATGNTVRRPAWRAIGDFGIIALPRTAGMTRAATRARRLRQADSIGGP